MKNTWVMYPILDGEAKAVAFQIGYSQHGNENMYAIHLRGVNLEQANSILGLLNDLDAYPQPHQSLILDLSARPKPPCQSMNLVLDLK